MGFFDKLNITGFGLMISQIMVIAPDEQVALS